MTPASSNPVHAICEPQSPEYSNGETKNFAFCLEQICLNICDSLLFAATPPTTSSSFFSVKDNGPTKFSVNGTSGQPVLQVTGDTKLDGNIQAVSLNWNPTYATASAYQVVGADQMGNLNNWFGVLTSGAYGTSNPPGNIGNDGDFLFST